MTMAGEVSETADEANIALLMETDPSIVIRDPKKLSALYSRIDSDIAAQVPDLSTEKGRKAIASLAFKIARTKTAVEGAAKKMTEEFRRQTTQVNAIRNGIVERLEARQKQARRPLDEWEDAEEARQQAVNDAIEKLRSILIVPIGASSDEIARRLAIVDATTFNSEVFREHLSTAQLQREQAIATLRDMHARAEKDEADRVELERLRAEQAKRDAEEAERRAAAEAEAALEVEREAEERRIAEATEKARLDAIAELERSHQAALKAERDRAEAAERDRREEADRIARDKEAAAVEAKRIADQDAARAKDKAHRKEILTAAVVAIKSAGDISADAAKAIVLAIANGQIANVSLKF